MMSATATIRQRLDLYTRRARFSPALFLADAGFTAWLAMAQQIFTDGAGRLWPQWALPAATCALLSWAVRWHDFGAPLRLRLVAIRGVLTGAACAAACLGWRGGGYLALSSAGCLWLAGAATLCLLVVRLVYFAVRAAHPDQPLEMARWLALTAGATALAWPFYFTGSVGAGDSHWYTIMLSDFVAQVRAGIFPVWVGQSVYAFNGANYPLRLAPWFQHAGGLLDLVTAHALAPLALKNSLLAVNALATAFSTYACLRAILHRRPNLALLLSLLWLACPGVLATLMIGDQYMTFMALPFVPPVLYGCWRNWQRNDRTARLLIAAGLAALWWSHSPVALWCTLLAAGHYAAHLLVRREWWREPRRIAGMAAVFLLLGALPFASVAALDNLIKIRSNGGSAFLEIRKAFPHNFRMIDPEQPGVQAYQLGYAIIGVGAAALLLLVRFRPPGTLAFAACAFAILPVTLPVPWFTQFFWTSAPAWFVTINNVWPMQRLFLIWAAVLVFLAASVLADPRLSARRWLAAGLGLALLAGGAWSWREAAILQAWTAKARTPSPKAAKTLAPENVILTRYAYANFAWVPAYVSHGYMAPELENRLVAPDTGKIITSNADAAAPLLASGGWAGTPARLEQSGVLTATSPIAGRNFDLDPPFHLAPGRPYALRVEFLHPNESGVLQIAHPSMQREYYLPDSGFGLNRSRPSRAFGSEPQCSHVIPLRVEGNEPITPLGRFFSNEDRPASFPLARFWLYSYSAANLPVAVQSWLPYRAKVTSPVPAWLETPRVWLPEWRAKLNGRDVPVIRSPENLVAVAVPPGESEVILEYRQRPGLNLIYWLCVLSWAALLMLGAVHVGRRARLPLASTGR